MEKRPVMKKRVDKKESRKISFALRNIPPAPLLLVPFLVALGLFVVISFTTEESPSGEVAYEPYVAVETKENENITKVEYIASINHLLSAMSEKDLIIQGYFKDTHRMSKVEYNAANQMIDDIWLIYERILKRPVHDANYEPLALLRFAMEDLYKARDGVSYVSYSASKMERIQVKEHLDSFHSKLSKVILYTRIDMEDDEL